VSETATGWIQTAGVGGFALLVLYLLRELRPILKEVGNELFEVRLFIAAMLEQARIRDVRRRREDSRQPFSKRSTPVRGIPVPVDEFGADEPTDIRQLVEIQRDAALKKRSLRSPRPGTHHDED
jgi:hypothetical protein